MELVVRYLDQNDDLQLDTGGIQSSIITGDAEVKVDRFRMQKALSVSRRGRSDRAALNKQLWAKIEMVCLSKVLSRTQLYSNVSC